MILTSPRSKCWKRACSNFAARSCSSRMIVTCSIAFRPPLSGSTALAAPGASPITRNGKSGRKNANGLPRQLQKHLTVKLLSAARQHRLPLRKRSFPTRSEEHTSELQSLRHLVCRLLLEKKKNTE